MPLVDSDQDHKMGNLLRLLSRDADSCCSLAKPGDLFVDFESAKATEEEAELYNEAESTLQKAAAILKELQEYKGASKEIKEAISLSTPEAEAEAWSAVRPLIFKLKGFFDFSKELDIIVPKILQVLCSPNADNIAISNSK